MVVSLQARGEFRFSLLNRRAMRTSDERVIERETHWKRVLFGPIPNAA
jgi:hypothetical protein